MSDFQYSILLVFFIFSSAFFSSSETALINLNKIRLKHLVKENVKNATILEKLYEKDDRLLGAILIGNNIVNIGASSIAATIASRKFANNGVGISIGIMTLIILIFGEITPKNYAMRNSEKISLKIAPFISLFVKICGPLLFILNHISDFISKVFGLGTGTNKPFITQDELKTIVHVSNQEGVLEMDETEMIQNIFEFKDATVGDIMVQRMDIVAVNEDMSYEEIIHVFKENRLSRIPVYRDTIDEIIGFLHAKDLFLKDANKDNFSISTSIREPVFVNEFIKVSVFFKKMQKHNTHIAIVLDEYGGVAGLVTMEDLIESIMGDIYDEYDFAMEEIKTLKTNVYVINGNAKLTDLEDTLNIQLKSEEYESLGGYIMYKLGEIPKEGQTLDQDGYKFIILSMDKNRINKVKVIKKQEVQG